MVTDVAYRKARPDDIAACIDLRGRTHENAISAERLRTMGITLESWAADVAAGVLPGYVCMSGSTLAGYCFGARDTGEIVVLALLPEFENQGVGRSLLELMVRDLQALGFDRLFLGCSSDPRTRSYGFYRHLGWRSTGRFDAHRDEVLEFYPGASGAARNVGKAVR
jgi:ribosomal protein S18 acetylase RimI-like enzyme